MNHIYFCVSLANREVDDTLFEHSIYKESRSDFPSCVTSGFRQSLYSVFSHIIKPTEALEKSIHFLEHELTLVDLQICKTTESFNVNTHPDTLVALHVVADDHFLKSLRTSTKGHDLGSDLINSLSQFAFGDALAKAANNSKGNRIAINWFVEGKENKGLASTDTSVTKTTLTAFYTTAWLTFQRITREHANIDLTPKKSKTRRDFTKTIVSTRIKILNIKRFIFTLNRTKHEDIKVFCDRIVDDAEFDIKTKLDNAEQLHASFETHLENYTSLEQLMNSDKTNFLLLLLSAGSISISLFSTAFVSVQDNILVFNLEKLLSPQILPALIVPSAFLLIILLGNKVFKFKL